MRNVKPITARQVGELARLLEERGIGRELLQEHLEGDGLKRLVASLEVYKYHPKAAGTMAALNIMRSNCLFYNQTIYALRRKGINIDLTREERALANRIPWSESLLREIVKGSWRGKQAILWWAPPERFGITMERLREAFGTNPAIQPCIHNNDWWVRERFAREVLREGWHLTLAEIPDETRDKTYDQQKALMTKYEYLLIPVELMFLSLLYYEYSNGERLFEKDYSRTYSLTSDGYVVHLGKFVSPGLEVRYWNPSDHYSNVGVVFSRKFD